MRIAWVLYGDLDQRTGGTLYDAIVVAGLRRRGDDVHVISLDRAPSVVRGPWLAREVRNAAPDVVVGDELCFRELAIAFPLIRRTPRVLLVHHLTAWEHELGRRERAVARVLERLALRASDLAIATSETTKRRLLAEGARVPVDVAAPGSDRLGIEHASRGEPGEHVDRGPPVDADGTRLVFVGAITKRKRALALVRAFARAARPNDRLVLVGSGSREAPYAREVAGAIDEHGLRGRVTMIGEVSESELARQLAHADALVMPSSLEGFGIAATEAVRAGTPVLASRTEGLVEALGPCDGAALFFDGDDDLVKTLVRFTRDAELRKAMARAAEESGPRLRTWEACVDSFRAAITRARRRRS